MEVLFHAPGRPDSDLLLITALHAVESRIETGSLGFIRRSEFYH